MIFLKTAEEIELIRNSSLLVSKTLAVVAELIAEGVSLISLDKRAEEHIRDNGGVPAFKGYKGFPGSLCISPNDEVVHGMPKDIPVKNGDILSVDCGVLLNGYYGDSAYTFAVGEIEESYVKLLTVTKTSLSLSAEKAVVGNRIGDIAFTIQDYCESNGFSIVRELVGHGIGKNLHEEPEVPNFGKRGSGVLLKKGMVIAIEPMVNAGSKNVKFYNDGWTVKTRDGKASCHFEHTLTVGDTTGDKLSDFDIIEKVINNNKNLVNI